jgi:crossover junction endodeoxyribonuclease RusA
VSVTDDDLLKAISLVADHQHWCHGEAHATCCGAGDCDCGVTESRQAVAEALADERVKARGSRPVTAVEVGDVLVITVYGKPVTQGAIRSLGKGRPSVHGNAARLLPWREAAKQAALDVLDGRPRLEGPVAVDVTFTFDRPKSAPRSRPCWPITRSSGDVDKLQRAIFDALTDAGVWFDDSQVTEVRARKAHAGDVGALPIPGARVAVWSAVPGGAS